MSDDRLDMRTAHDLGDAVRNLADAVYRSLDTARMQHNANELLQAALGEAEATITGLREALCREHKKRTGHMNHLTCPTCALARPEFPDTESRIPSSKES